MFIGVCKWLLGNAVTFVEPAAAGILRMGEETPGCFGSSFTTRQLPEIAVPCRLVPVVGLFQYCQRGLIGRLIGHDAEEPLGEEAP